MLCESGEDHSLRLLAHRGLFLLFHLTGSVGLISWSGIGYLHDMVAGCILGCGLGLDFVSWDKLLEYWRLHILMGTDSMF